MALHRTWAERCAEDAVPPQKMRLQTANCTIGGNSPTEVYGIIENTPGNTPMNKAMGGTYKFPGKYSTTGEWEGSYEWLSLQGQPESYYWTNPGR